MDINVVICALIGTLVPLGLIICRRFWRKSRLQKTAEQRRNNYQVYRLKKVFLTPLFYCAVIDIFLSSFWAISLYGINGYWDWSYFAVALNFLLGSSLPICVAGYFLLTTIKRNLLVKHFDYSLINIIKTFGYILLVACLFVLGLLASRLNISEGTVDSLIFICIVFGGFTVWIYSSSKKNRIEKGFNAGLEAFKNVKGALSYSVDLEKLKPCVNSDIVEPNRSLSFDINGSCVDFLSINFKVHTGKGSYMDNITETFHYKMKKTAKNSIICTFDSELTDCPLNPIETENPAFNKTYTVYCQNAEDAFYILTPHIMEEMLEVQAKCKRAIWLFDQDDVLVILYTNEFLRRLSARSAISEFGRLQDIANVVILDSLIKEKGGAKTSSSRKTNTEAETTKKETKKEFFTTRKRIIISIVIAVPIVLFFGSALVRGIASSVQESSIDIKLKDSQPPDEYVNLTQDYLLKKYNKQFKYDKNTSYYFEGTYSKSIDCYYTDDDNNLFIVSGKLSNEEDNMVFTDNYQTNMYSHQLRDEITGTYSEFNGAYPPAPWWAVKLNGLQDYIDNLNKTYKGMDIAFYLNKSFDDITNDRLLEISNQIIKNYKIDHGEFHFNNSNYNTILTIQVKDGICSVV